MSPLDLGAVLPQTGVSHIQYRHILFQPMSAQKCSIRHVNIGCKP